MSGCYANSKMQLLTPKGFPVGVEEPSMCTSAVLRAVQGDACRMYWET